MTMLNYVSKAWKHLPTGGQDTLEGTILYRYLRAELARREALVNERISPTDDFSFEVTVPARFEPWWLDYDPEIERSSHEPITTRTFVEYVESDDVVWDMGSQYGYFAQLAAALNDDPSQVHVFEMSPYKCIRIRRISREKYGPEGLVVVEARVDESDGPDAVSGDAYAVEHGVPDLVKVDIEGAEVHGIAGMTDTIENHQPTLIIEMHPNKIEQDFGASEADVLDTVVPAYETTKVCRNFRELEAEWESWEEMASPVEASRGMDGAVDLDSYQLLCHEG